jgi:hypothetical protein
VVDAIRQGDSDAKVVELTGLIRRALNQHGA